MNPTLLGIAVKLAAIIGGAVSVVAAWTFYQNPALGLLLDSFRFCG